MSIKNKIIIGLVAASIIVGSVMVGCSTDIALPPLPSLLGDYEGKYTVITNYNLSGQQTEEYDITWRFSDQSYWVTSVGDSVCSPSGAYIYADNVMLEEIEKNCSATISSEEINPRGAFSIRQPVDSVIMTQLSGDTLKEVRLVKIAE